MAMNGWKAYLWKRLENLVGVNKCLLSENVLEVIGFTPVRHLLKSFFVFGVGRRIVIITEDNVSTKDETEVKVKEAKAMQWKWKRRVRRRRWKVKKEKAKEIYLLYTGKGQGSPFSDGLLSDGEPKLNLSDERKGGVFGVCIFGVDGTRRR